MSFMVKITGVFVFRVMSKAGERGGGAGGAKYLGPRLVWAARNFDNIWSLRHCQEGWGPVMRNHLLVLGPDHGSRRPW